MLVYNAGLITLPPPLVVGSIAMSVYVCLFVCLSVCWRVSNTILQTLPHFLYVLPGAIARSSSDDNGIRFPLSCFPIMGPMACGMRGNITLCYLYCGNIYVSALPEQVVKSPTYSPGCAPLFTWSSYTIAANCTPGAKAAVCDCLVCGLFPIFTHAKN